MDQQHQETQANKKPLTMLLARGSKIHGRTRRAHRKPDRGRGDGEIRTDAEDFSRRVTQMLQSIVATTEYLFA